MYPLNLLIPWILYTIFLKFNVYYQLFIGIAITSFLASGRAFRSNLS